MARHSLDGLMKWASRPEWHGELQSVIAQHLEPACDEMGVDLDRLPELLGDDYLRNLWGCAFEDFLTREIDGRNVVDEYLKRRGWKESAETCTYVKALRHAVMSLYEVSNVRRDEGFFVRDLVRGGEPVWVQEKSGTHYLAQWDRVAARVVSVRGRTQLAGGLLSFERELSDKLIDALKQTAGMSPRNLADAIAGLAEEAGAKDDADIWEVVTALRVRPVEMTIDAVLAASGFMFTTYSLRNVLGSVLDPRLPELVNSDGDAIEWIDVRYPLVGAGSRAKVMRALADVPVLWPEGRSTWTWVRSESGRKKTKRKHILEDGVMLVSEKDDGSTILGTIECKHGALTLSVNSEKREIHGRTLIESTVGTFLGKPTVTHRSTEDFMADRDGKYRKAGAAATEEIPIEDQQAITRQYLDDYYSRLLDEPVPALGNASPRAAVNSETNRAKVVGWLRALENNHARQARRDPTQQYDCSWIWHELGLNTYRR